MNPMPMIADAASERMVRRDMIGFLILADSAEWLRRRLQDRPTHAFGRQHRFDAGNMQIRQIVSHGLIYLRRPNQFVESTVVDPAGNFELDLVPSMKGNDSFNLAVRPFRRHSNNFIVK